MNMSVWCELTNRVVVRWGTGDLDARQRWKYLTHVKSCLPCRSRLAAAGRVLYATLDNEDPAVWPHVATATLNEIASLAAASDLLRAFPAIAVHLEECRGCAARMSGGVATAATSDTTPIAWELRGERGELRWFADSPLLPESTWTIRLLIANGRLRGELEVAAGEELEWAATVVTFPSASGTPALTFSPSILHAEVELDADSAPALASAVCAVTILPGEWQAYVDGGANHPTLRDALNAPQAPCRLRIAAPHSPYDALTASITLASTLAEDAPGRPVRFVSSVPLSSSGSIESLAGDPIGRWTAFARNGGADVIIESDLPNRLWLSRDLDDYDVEVLPVVTIVERDRSIRIAGKLAAASGGMRPAEKGRRFLGRGRIQVPLEDGTAIELQERDGKLLVRWLEGKPVRLKDRSAPLGQRFEEIATSAESDLQTVITSALEWVD